MKTQLILTACCLALLLASCKKKEDDQGNPSPVSMALQFELYDSGNPLVLDSLMYVTSLGNQYMVTDVQYFISDVVFHMHGGKNIYVTDGDSIHYGDARIASTSTWSIDNTVFPAGDYDSISFTFGMNAQRNRSNRYSDPPERDMFWPDILGGGYHYMKLNMKWKNDTMQEPMPFMFHLGIGQIYSSPTPTVDSITGYVQNFFDVNLPSSSFTLESGHICTVVIRMNIERWFDGNNAFDFASYPNGIMQNEEGMHLGCLNGRNVFTVQVNLVKLM
jgi:hypothetical protein